MSVTSQDGLPPILVSYADGEDLYIHPYSAHEYWWSPKHRVRWLRLQEFEPHENWLQDLIWDISGNYGSALLHCLRRWFWMGPARWFLSAITGLKWNLCWYWRRPRLWFEWLHPFLIWYPVRCLELYPDYLGLTGQLQVNDPEELSETCYLTPSDKYIELRLNQSSDRYLARIEDGSAADWEWGALEDLAGFLEWKHQQEALKREVHYLVSLDT
jgi:hypothetical protein